MFYTEPSYSLYGLRNSNTSASRISGSLCDSWSASCYLLPVLDTVLVRRSWRRRGFGLQMLEDFCSSFPTERFLGVSSPLSPSMVAGQLRVSFICLYPPTKPIKLFIYIPFPFFPFLIFSHLEEHFVRFTIFGRRMHISRHWLSVLLQLHSCHMGKTTLVGNVPTHIHSAMMTLCFTADQTLKVMKHQKLI